MPPAVAADTVIVQLLLLRAKVIVGAPAVAAHTVFRIPEQNADAQDVIVDFAVMVYV